MRTMQISLPDPIKKYVEQQVSKGEYSSVSEYLRELVHADQRRHAKDELEQVLHDAVHSGKAFEITAEMTDEVRRGLRARAAQRAAAQH